MQTVLIFYCFVVTRSPGGPRTTLTETNGKQSGTSVKSSSVMFQVRFSIHTVQHIITGMMRKRVGNII